MWVKEPLHSKARTRPQFLQKMRCWTESVPLGVALKQGDIQICSNCTDSIREFGLYRWNGSTGWDAPIKENDHAMDDIRYFVTTVLEQDGGGFFAIAARRR